MGGFDVCLWVRETKPMKGVLVVWVGVGGGCVTRSLSYNLTIDLWWM